MAPGADWSPKSPICSERGILIFGALLRETTSVAVMAVDPEPSFAMMSTGTPTTTPPATSSSFGVPTRRPVPSSIESHAGAPRKVYLTADEAVNVCGDKVYEKASEILATGGNCELKGKDIAGAAATILRRLRAASKREL